MPGKTDHDDQAGAERPAPPKPSVTKPSSSGDRDTGAALRSVYQKTVDEAVPDEMLDLLGRLD